MMQTGNTGGRDKEGAKKSSVGDEWQFSVCDLSSDDFKKTWLILKELHDKELRRLQVKLTNLRKERLADGRRTGLIAKIRELTEQQKVLHDTIDNLRQQLSSKTCDRCSINEAYRRALQQEFYNIHQQNLKFITELCKEKSKLREENKKLSARLKPNIERFHVSFSDSDDDTTTSSQRILPVFSVRDPPQGTQVNLPIRVMTQSHTQLMKRAGLKELQQSSKLSTSLYVQDVFEMSETSFVKTSSNGSKPITGGKADQKSPVHPLKSTFDAKKWFGFEDVSDTPKDTLCRAKTKCEKISTQKTTQNTTQKHRTQIDLSWSLSSISSGEKQDSHLVSETSEEKMPGYNKALLSSTQKKETLPLNVFDCTLRSGEKGSVLEISRYNTGFGVRDVSFEKPSIERSTLKKSNDSTSTGYAADKTQDDTESSLLRSTLKRRARTQLEKKRK